MTGGGWINSPVGAYAANPTLTGKASFGFVSKYQTGAKVPTGQTQFEFAMGSFDFHSAIYEWLVVPGPKAQYRGSGTINGVGDYAFLLTVTDGDLAGGGSVDKFRIKISNKSTGQAVYDNVASAQDQLDAANPQAIASGRIIIHNK